MLLNNEALVVFEVQRLATLDEIQRGLGSPPFKTTTNHANAAIYA